MARQVGDVARQRAELERCLELDPRHIGAHAVHAQCLEEAGDLDGAIAELDVAVGLAPEDPMLLFKHASVEVRRGDLQAAESDYRLLLERAPGSDVAPRLRAYLDQAARRR